MLPKESLIEELHDIRERLWLEAGADMATFFRQLKTVETQNKNRLIGPCQFRKAHPESGLCSSPSAAKPTATA